MVTKKRQGKIAPSRARYEAANPTVSIRVSQDLKEELEELKIMSGVSMADVLQAGLDKLQPDTEQIYERGYRDGYEVAKEEFSVFAPCGACGKVHIPMVGERMKAALAQKLRLTGWSAKSCR